MEADKFHDGSPGRSRNHLGLSVETGTQQLEPIQAQGAQHTMNQAPHHMHHQNQGQTGEYSQNRNQQGNQMQHSQFRDQSLCPQAANDQSGPSQTQFQHQDGQLGSHRSGTPGRRHDLDLAHPSPVYGQPDPAQLQSVHQQQQVHHNGFVQSQNNLSRQGTPQPQRKFSQPPYQQTQTYPHLHQGQRQLSQTVGPGQPQEGHVQSRIGYFGQFQQGNGYGPPPPGRPQHAPGQQYQCNQDGPSLALSHPQQTFGRVQTAPMYPSAQQGMPMEARSNAPPYLPSLHSFSGSLPVTSPLNPNNPYWHDQQKHPYAYPYSSSGGNAHEQRGNGLGPRDSDYGTPVQRSASQMLPSASLNPDLYHQRASDIGNSYNLATLDYIGHALQPFGWQVGQPPLGIGAAGDDYRMWKTIFDRVFTAGHQGLDILPAEQRQRASIVLGSVKANLTRLIEVVRHERNQVYNAWNAHQQLRVPVYQLLEAPVKNDTDIKSVASDDASHAAQSRSGTRAGHSGETFGEQEGVLATARERLDKLKELQSAAMRKGGQTGEQLKDLTEGAEALKQISEELHRAQTAMIQAQMRASNAASQLESNSSSAPPAINPPRSRLSAPPMTAGSAGEHPADVVQFMNDQMQVRARASTENMATKGPESQDAPSIDDETSDGEGFDVEETDKNVGTTTKTKSKSKAMPSGSNWYKEENAKLGPLPTLKFDPRTLYEQGIMPDKMKPHIMAGGAEGIARFVAELAAENGDDSKKRQCSPAPAADQSPAKKVRNGRKPPPNEVTLSQDAAEALAKQSGIPVIRLDKHGNRQ